MEEEKNSDLHLTCLADEMNDERVMKQSCLLSLKRELCCVC